MGWQITSNPELAAFACWIWVGALMVKSRPLVNCNSGCWSQKGNSIHNSHQFTHSSYWQSLIGVQVVGISATKVLTAYLHYCCIGKANLVVLHMHNCMLFPVLLGATPSTTTMGSGSSQTLPSTRSPRRIPHQPCDSHHRPIRG